MSVLPAAIGWLATAMALAGIAYTLIAAALIRHPGPRIATMHSGPSSAVTLLKPLHFDEPRLGESLRSFAEQDYAGPAQLVFGVQIAADTAIPVVETLKAAYPAADITLVANVRERGTNRKVSNLINMLEAAKHPVLVLSDSDIKVARGYLSGVVSSLEQPGVGAVTALYVGRPIKSFWAMITAMGISYQFLPNVLVGVAAGLAKPCFGSTIALQRDTLASIGGFEALANQLADDYELGNAVRRLGLKVVLAPSAVEHICAQRSSSASLSQELRWARTIAAIDPAGHAGSVVTFPLAWALIALAFWPGTVSLVVLLGAALSRGILKVRIDQIFAARSGPIWLLPVRDIFAFAIFLASFIGRSVEWRGRGFRVETDGALSEPNGSH